MVKKKKIDLQNMSYEFSVEDLINGTYESERKTISLEDVDYLNKMGIFSSLKDKSKDYNKFSFESMTAYKDSESMGAFATQQLNEINNRMKLCAKISKVYALESSHMYTIGMEGVKDTLKRIGVAIITAFKKLAMSIVKNVKALKLATVGLLTIKKTEDFYSSNVGKSFDSDKGREIKVLIPTVDMKKVMSDIYDKLKSFYNSLEGIKLNIESNREVNNVATLDEKFKSLITSITGLHSSSKDIDGISPTKYANKIIYGTEKPKPQKMKTGKFLNEKYCTLEAISPSNLRDFMSSVEKAADMLKPINKAIKEVDKIMKAEAKAQNDKESAKKMKGIRSDFRFENKKRMILSKFSLLIVILMDEHMKNMHRVYQAAKSYLKDSGEGKSKK